VNAILLIGSAELLHSVRDLANNYLDEKGTTEKQQEILRSLIFRMRGDLGLSDSEKLTGFDFPLLVPDLEAEPEERTADQPLPRN
jgi:hypothetical protein